MLQNIFSVIDPSAVRARIGIYIPVHLHHIPAACHTGMIKKSPGDNSQKPAVILHPFQGIITFVRGRPFFFSSSSR